MSPSGPLQPPGGAGGSPEPQGAGPGGGPISPQSAVPDPNAEVLRWGTEIVRNARRIGMKFPACSEEARAINNQWQKMQQKIIQSSPAPEPQAPPV